MTARIFVGTCSWSDPTLIATGALYPPQVTTPGPGRLQASPASSRR